MVDSQVVAFALVAAILTITPGADTMLVVRNVLRGGRHNGIITTFGICTGLFLHATLSALGVSVILVHSTAAFHLVKFAGACYLVWMGFQSLLSAVRGTHASESMQRNGTVQASSPQRCFLEGFLSNMLNPKVAVFYLAFLPQFIGPMDPVLPKSLLLAGIHYVQGIVWLVVVSMVVDKSRQFFLKSTMHRWLNGLCGAVLLGLGVRLAFERR